MDTIKIQVQVTPAIEEREINLPAFRKWNDVYYKIISRSVVVVVNNYSTTNGISITQLDLHTHATNSESVEITEQEFNDQYNAMRAKHDDLAQVRKEVEA